MRRLLIFVLCLFPSVAVSADEKKAGRHESLIPPAITKISVAGPVPGGQATLGGLETEAHSGAVLIQMSSSNPAVAKVGPVSLAAGVTRAYFRVDTGAVRVPTDVTISANSGRSTATATLQVLPPKLSLVGCKSPGTVTAGKPLTCTVWVDALAAVEVPVAISAEPPVVQVPPSVVIVAGAKKAEFQVVAASGQQATARVIATYGGVSKSAPVTVAPRALNSLTLSPTRVRSGSEVTGTLTTTAPAEGLPVRLSAKLADVGGFPGQVLASSLLSMPNEVTVGGPTFPKSSVTFRIQTERVMRSYLIKILAVSDLVTSSDVKEATLTIEPWAHLEALPISSGFPLIGTLEGNEVHAQIRMDRSIPDGITVDLTYGGEVQITGPSRVGIPKGSQYGSYTFKVFPCSIKDLCAARITAKYLDDIVTRDFSVK